MKKQRASVVLTIVMLFAGFLLSFQYNQAKSWSLASPREAGKPEQQEQELVVRNELLQIREENQRLEEQLVLLQTETSQLEYKLSEQEGTEDTLYRQLEEYRMMAGMVAVYGPGIVITLNDSPLAKDIGGEEKEKYLVHVQDLRAIVNDLFLAGAEAVSINGQRINPISSLRCIGPVIYVNGVVVAPPFEIKAIGNADVLHAAMNFPGGILEILRKYTFQVNVKKADELELANFSGDMQIPLVNATEQPAVPSSVIQQKEAVAGETQ